MFLVQLKTNWTCRTWPRPSAPPVPSPSSGTARSALPCWSALDFGWYYSGVSKTTASQSLFAQGDRCVLCVLCNTSCKQTSTVSSRLSYPAWQIPQRQSQAKRGVGQLFSPCVLVIKGTMPRERYCASKWGLRKILSPCSMSNWVQHTVIIQATLQNWTKHVSGLTYSHRDENSASAHIQILRKLRILWLRHFFPTLIPSPQSE